MTRPSPADEPRPAASDAADRLAPTLPRRIAHFDLDTFFVSVERALDPALIGKPVLVGGTGGRGVVASASYESREFGCHSAQPMSQALRLCPEAVVVPPHFDRYQASSRAFHAILRDESPIVEPGGIDEAYADLTGLGEGGTGARAAAERVRTRTREELTLPVSVCIAGSRTTAKVGSDRAKPDGLLEVPVGEDAAFLAPLPLRELPLVGPRFGEQLVALGVRTIGEAAALDARWLEQRFGRAGVVLSERARGLDPTAVRAGGRGARSISREVTFGEDVTDLERLRRTLRDHAERVGTDLRRQQRRARTVTLKLRWSDFTTLSRSRTLDRPVQGTEDLAAAGHALLDELLTRESLRPVRLIGLGATNLVEDAVQLGFDDASTRRAEQVDRAVDAIRGRYGDDSVTRGM